jgi:hypothetical protein
MRKFVIDRTGAATVITSGPVGRLDGAKADLFRNLLINLKIWKIQPVAKYWFPDGATLDRGRMHQNLLVW